MPEDSAMGQWGPIWRKLGKHIGTEFDIVSSDVMSDDPKMKQVGLYLSATVTHDIDGFLTYLLHNYENWTPQEIHNYASIMRKEFRECKIHSNSKWRVVRGQKPLDA
ncbi:hypothetical protein B0T09DRAFT_386980 [Sordaria sp. MPI-SDFR-AT-0083]|nr:hypothetical protein B0T09DRAFT_386980 [Sordaria sp. MPI-SDFR-AT-0083]